MSSMEDHSHGSSTPTSGVGKSGTSVFDSVKNAVKNFVDSANRANFTTRQKVLETVDSFGRTSDGSLEGTGRKTGARTGTRTVDEGHSSVSHNSAPENTIGDAVQTITGPIERARLQARAAIDRFGEKQNTRVNTPSDRGDI